MTAYPTTCLVSNEDGYRTVITLEESSDSYIEQGAMGVLVVSGDRPGGELRIGLSHEALEALERRCRELRGVPEDEAPEPGTVVARVACPCCDARIEVQAGDDDEPEHVTVSQGASPVVEELRSLTTWRPITEPPTAEVHAWCGGRYLMRNAKYVVTYTLTVLDGWPRETWVKHWLPIPPMAKGGDS